jgi:hypothetical protein
MVNPDKGSIEPTGKVPWKQKKRHTKYENVEKVQCSLIFLSANIKK